MSAQVNGQPPTPSDVPVVEAIGLVKHFPVGRGLFRGATAAVQAVDGISFAVPRSRTLGLVGESGCGKTTTGKLVLQVRYKRRETGEIVRVEPEEPVKRRRLRV